MKKIAFATCEKLPRLTADDALALTPLRAANIEVMPAPWNGPQIDWRQFDAVIVRSCWDYHLHAEKFQRWVNGVKDAGVALWNSPEILLWNMNKAYLKDLSARGVRIPETVWQKARSPADLSQLMRQHHLNEAVIKPAVSATAYQTFRATPGQAGQYQQQFQAALQGGDVLVQAFLPQIEQAGEWSLLFFDKRYSHAVKKYPRSGDFRVQNEFGGSAVLERPAESLIRQATKILSMVEADLLYARVDGVEIDGKLVLLELELIEPELFLRLDPAAPERFCRAISTWL